MKFEFISAHVPKKAAPADGVSRFSVVYMCDKLDVSRQGYYAWKKRGPSQHDKDDAALSTKIKSIFDFRQGRYGVRRIFHEIHRQGIKVAYKRVQRLMRTLGLVSVHPRPRRTTTVQATEPSGLRQAGRPGASDGARITHRTGDIGGFGMLNGGRRDRHMTAPTS